MTEGFALTARPATHGASGIMTFMVDQDSIVYWKDLGPRTATVAGAMMLVDPDLTWARIDTTGR